MAEWLIQPEEVLQDATLISMCGSTSNKQSPRLLLVQAWIGTEVQNNAETAVSLTAYGPILAVQNHLTYMGSNSVLRAGWSERVSGTRQTCQE